jgi:hypothetical protein
MAISRVSLSGEHLSIDDIEDYFNSTEQALRQFYNERNAYFAGYTPEELNVELEERIDELDKSTALTVLAAVEAHIRVDYLQRCYAKDKEALSRKFRELYKEKGRRARLEEELLELWKDYVSLKSVISDMKSAFKYRHWLAHGRYWLARVGRRYDFHSVLTLAVQAQSQMNIDMGA